MYSQRIRELRSSFMSYGIDSFFVSNYFNILYLTGFKTLTTDEREAFVLITGKNVYLFTDARYVHKDRRVILKLIESGKGLFYHLRTIAEADKLEKIAIESEDLRVHEYKKLQELLPDTAIVPTERLIIQQRAIKEEGEIECVAKACEITDQCLRETTSTIKVGNSEKQIAFGIETWVRERGYDLAFDPIVAVNQNSAIPHYHTKEGSGSVEKQSIILIDFGIKYRNYLSDITRMVFIKPTQDMLHIYEVLLSIQTETVEKINVLHNAKDLDEFCRKHLAGKNLPNFSHSLGHGVGLEIHEFPKLSSMSLDTIQEGHVFTVEPGVYFPGRWGMRIEDTVVYQNGTVKPLTQFSKQPLILQ